MRLYESIFIARPDLTTQDADKLADQFSQVVKEGGGKILKTELKKVFAAEAEAV